MPFFLRLDLRDRATSKLETPGRCAEVVELKVLLPLEVDE
jgi:hypothetical protein